MRINFYHNPGYFKLKFKRNPKFWTIEQIHDLWMKAMDRSEKKRRELTDYTKEIVKEIEPNSKQEYSVYYNRNNQIYAYRFSKDDRYNSGGYWVHRDVLNLENRDDKISFILNNDRQFEMGEEYNRLDKLTSNLHYRVREVLWQIVSDNLRKKFKNKISPSIFKIKMGDREYYVSSHESGYGFILGPECLGDTIDMNN